MHSPPRLAQIRVRHLSTSNYLRSSLMPDNSKHGASESKIRRDSQCQGYDGKSTRASNNNNRQANEKWKNAQENKQQRKKSYRRSFSFFLFLLSDRRHARAFAHVLTHTHTCAQTTVREQTRKDDKTILLSDWKRVSSDSEWIHCSRSKHKQRRGKRIETNLRAKERRNEFGENSRAHTVRFLSSVLTVNMYEEAFFVSCRMPAQYCIITNLGS